MHPWRWQPRVLGSSSHCSRICCNTPPFVDPVFPGAAAITPPNSTGPQITAIEQQFNKALRQWTVYKNLTDAGKKFIQDGIGIMYLKGTTDRNVGLADVTIREILDFLFQNYGIITQYDIEENDKKLKEKWDADTPIEMLFDQIDDTQDFAAAAGKPYMNNQLLTTPITLYTQRPYFSMIAKLGIDSQQTRKQWTTSKPPFNKHNENYVINKGPHNMLVSKPIGFGANPPRPIPLHSRKQPKHWQT